MSEHLLGVVRDASAALGDGMHTTASVGVAFDSASSLEPAVMLNAADSAMYVAKRAGGNRVSTANPPTRSRRQTRASDGSLPPSLSSRAVRDPVL